MISKIYTLQDLIDYLQCFDTSKPIHGEYIKIFGDTVCGFEYRPLIDPLIEETNNGEYKLKALIY